MTETKQTKSAFTEKSIVKKCMQKCRWCPLIAVIFGIIFLLLGYFLNAEIIRVFWMINAGIVILMGTLCLIMMNVMVRAIDKKHSSNFDCPCGI
jgi:hypothetical protein